VNPSSPTTKKDHSSSRGAFLVSAGILLSRIAGLIRERVFAHYFGSSDAADVFKAALRIPNFLQNLFGEGVLSASFIPVYAKLRAEGRHDEARSVAVVVGLWLFLLVLILSGIGIWLTPLLIDLITPGFEGEKRAATIELVRIFFPSAGLLVLSAWCLGVLNTHGRFFLSYSAPVLWNLTIIFALWWFGGSAEHYQLAILSGYGVVLGSLLQTVVQLPSTKALLSDGGTSLRSGLAAARSVFTNFIPVVIGRGVVQISAFIDSIIASLLPTGAVAGLVYAQTIYLLPISLFGMSISAAELPTMSALSSSEDGWKARLNERMQRSLERLAFFVVPSAAAFLGLGDVIACLLYQSGKFTAADGLYVWGILAGSAVGLLAATMGRLFASAFYALQDTRTPLRFAIIRVTLSIALGTLAALKLPTLLGLESRWGVAALTLAAGLAGWIECYLLQAALSKKIGPISIGVRQKLALWAAGALALAAAWGAKIILTGSIAGALHGILQPLVVLLLFGVVYLLVTLVQRQPQALALKSTLLRRKHR
jgi:putative peptidoglycan lipid II flippase